MGPRGDRDYRAGEPRSLVPGDNLRAGEPRSLVPGDNLRSDKPEAVFAHGEEKPHETQGQEGDRKKRRFTGEPEYLFPSDNLQAGKLGFSDKNPQDAEEGDGKKRRHITREPGSLFPGGQYNKYRADEPTHLFSDGEKEKPHDGEAAPLFRSGEAEAPVHFCSGGDKKPPAMKITGEPKYMFPGDNLRSGSNPGFSVKNPHDAEEGDGKKRRHITREPGSLFPGGQYNKYRADEPTHLFSDGEREKPHDGEAAPLFRSGEAEPVHLCSDGDKKPPAVKITERTPALVAEALRANGAPPRRLLNQGYESSDEDEEEDEDEDPVALALYWRGVEREDRYDPYVDYFFVGRPQAESWYRIWRDRPLVLHDAGLVAAIDSVIVWEPGLRTRYLDVSDHVTRVLENHPGPVSTLRFDSSEFPSRQELNRWMSLLTLKQAKGVILINVTAPTQTEVPLEHLCSRGLCYLGVGFVDLRDCLGRALESAGEDGHPWCTLRHLSLTACLFLGPLLSQTVRDLWGLRSLTISHCALTEGCDDDTGLHLESPGLVSLVFSSCTVDRKLVIGRAPSLATLQLGIWSASTCSLIHIDSCENLCEIRGLLLPSHRIALLSNYTKKVNRRLILSFRCLINVVAIVDMATTGTRALLGFLNMVPNLERLTVLCAHSRDSDEQELPRINSLGIIDSLQHLIVKHFTGRKGEMRFVLAILDAAQRLVSVAVHPDFAMSMPRKELAKVLKEYLTASKHCRIRVGACSGCGST